MISILSMAINTAISFCLYILKAVFSMLLWFIKAFCKALKLFVSALPITAALFMFLLVICALAALSGNNSLSMAAPLLFKALGGWWLDALNGSKNTASYALILIMSLLMFVPVVTVFLCISVFASFSLLLFYAFLADIAVYVLRALFGKNFVAQFLSRYYFLFPESGKRHYEKSYGRWLRRHHHEFEDDDRVNDFYGAHENDDYGSDERDYYRDNSGYDEEYDGAYEDEDYEGFGDEDEFYEEDFEDDEGFEDDEDYGNDEDYDDEYYGDEDYGDDDGYGDDGFDDEDNYDDFYEDTRSKRSNRGNSRQNKGNSQTAFNFFAGCNSRESVEKKYRSLAKLYHPDNMDGDTASIQEINSQYEEAKKRFRS